MSYIVRKLFFAGLLALPLFGVACASPAADDGSSSEANDTVGTTAAPAPFTAADHLDAYTARMRVSVDGAAAVEVTGMCSVDSWTSDAKQFRCSGDLGGRVQIILDLGKAGALSPVVGTYSSADGTGAVDEYTWSDTTAAVAIGSTASITLDSVVAASAPSDELRVIGSFQATAGGAQGLPHAVMGTFLADVPTVVAGVSTK